MNKANEVPARAKQAETTSHGRSRSHDSDGTYVGGTGQRCQSKQIDRSRPTANFAAMELLTKTEALLFASQSR